MNIVIIQEAGRHKENYEFRECLCLKRALLREGHSCVVWGKGFDLFAEPLETFVEDADVVLLLENYDETGWVPCLKNVGVTKIFWSIDSHCALQNHQKVCEFHGGFDIILTSVMNAVEKFEKHSNMAKWFPNAYPGDLLFPSPAIQKRVMAGYCGSLGCQERVDLLAFLSENVQFAEDIMVVGENMRTAIESYDIHINRNQADDINCRTFETMGIGTMLLTNNTPGLNVLFDVGFDLDTYDSKEDCADKLIWYSNNPSKRDAIATHGHEKVLRNHTYDSRAIELTGLITDGG